MYLCLLQTTIVLPRLPFLILKLIIVELISSLLVIHTICVVLEILLAVIKNEAPL